MLKFKISLVVIQCWCWTFNRSIRRSSLPTICAFPPVWDAWERWYCQRCCCVKKDVHFSTNYDSEKLIFLIEKRCLFEKRNQQKTCVLVLIIIVKS